MVPVACKTVFWESVVVLSVCKESLAALVVLVLVKPDPLWTIFAPVAFVRLANVIALLLSEYTFLYKFDILVSMLADGELKYLTPLIKLKELSPKIVKLLPVDDISFVEPDISLTHST